MKNKRLPNFICTSVIRASNKGEAHGGIYLVNPDEKRVNKVYDWNDQGIEWGGRGGDRGLRGIAIYKDHIYIAASNEIFKFNRDFKIINSYKNQYLYSCHEIFVKDQYLYITSTHYDSIIVFDLESEKFTNAHCMRKKPSIFNRFKKLKDYAPDGKKDLEFYSFDPNKKGGPMKADIYHINSVYLKNKKIYFSGTLLNKLYEFDFKTLRVYSEIPYGTHNSYLYGDNICLNNTKDNSVIIQDTSGDILLSCPLIEYDRKELLHSDNKDNIARAGFGRGLCFFENYIIGGSSPATISVYNKDTGKPVTSVNISMDIRNAIHGLAIWPWEI